MNEPFDSRSIAPLLRSEPFTAADRTFVEFLQETYGEENPHALLAAALCLSATRRGHSYLDLSQPIQDEVALPQELQALAQPLENWSSQFSASPSIGTPEDALPLVFVEPNALYLNKYYFYERSLSKKLVERISSSNTQFESHQASPESDLQQQAVSRALSRKFYLISGGPGTGKTTTVLQYLRSVLVENDDSQPLRIVAAAPTGKAAARLSESIRSGIDQLDDPDELKEQLRDVPCMTIHRMLGGIPHRTRFRHDQSNPLEHDIVVVDECSMIDLPLMQKLLDALRDEASLVLLGDHHQLSSVEVGSVFGDLNRSASDPASLLNNHSTTLEKTYRFSDDSSIYQLCQACKNGDSKSFTSLLGEHRDDLTFRKIDSKEKSGRESILDQIERGYQDRANSKSLHSAYGALGKFIALTPFNIGAFGARSINQLVDDRIRRKQGYDREGFYPGMPIIVLENNYDLEVFNGDIGIVWPDSDSGALFAWFSDSENGLKRVYLDWLPKHDLAYCLTIHKSQGSEFDQVAGIFPPEDSEFTNRELVYTCCSRAKRSISLYGDEAALGSAIDRSVKRATRLEAQIKEAAQ